MLYFGVLPLESWCKAVGATVLKEYHSNFHLASKPASDGLQPKSDGLQVNIDGLQPKSV